MLRREFSPREKALLVILAVLLLAVCYMKLVYQPVTEGIIRYQEETAAYDGMITEQSARMLMLERLEGEADELMNSAKEIPQGDHLTALMAELDGILSAANSYTLAFGEPEELDYLRLRPVTITVFTGSYAEARAILDKLDAGSVGQIYDVSFDNVVRAGGTLCRTVVDITYFELK